jgi:mRNA interferase RelE/StbE
MASYSLLFKRSVAKDLRSIPKKDVQRILKRIEALSNEPRPRGCEKLADGERYRIRQGAYRILYEIHDEDLAIVVVKVAKRSNAYNS